MPAGRIGAVVLAGNAHRTINTLKNYGFDCILTQPCLTLSENISCHADMLCHHLGSEYFVVARGQNKLARKLKGLGAKVVYSKRELLEKYPFDIALNVLRIGNLCFGRKDSIDDRILKAYSLMGIKVVNINQGYSKCSVCVVDDTSIITADNGIALAAGKEGLSVLHISPGNIELPGANYGFIGGASGKLNKNLLAFAGDINTHPQGEEIIEFCKDRGVQVLSLHNGPLQDIGGILPITERA